MSMKVCNMHNVKNHIHEADFIVSITDPGVESPVKGYDVKFIHVSFEDTEHPTDLDFMSMRRAVIDILDAVDKNQLKLSSNIRVHCRAGVSRSSAVAWLILIKLGMDYKMAFNKLIGGHPQIWPNTMVLSIGASILKLEPEFISFVTQVNSEIATNRREYLGYGG